MGKGRAEAERGDVYMQRGRYDGMEMADPICALAPQIFPKGNAPQK
jgi:hypothetical protein